MAVSSRRRVLPGFRLSLGFPVGGFVKVLLRLPSGDEVSVEVPRSEFDALGVTEGDSVRADVRSATVFVGDYAS